MIQLAAVVAAAMVNSRREGWVDMPSVSIGSSRFLLHGAAGRPGRRFGRQCVESWLGRGLTVGNKQIYLWLRSSFRYGVLARPRASRAVSPHDIGRRHGKTLRTEPAHRWPGGGSRGC